MTVRGDLAAILGRVAEGSSPERAAGLVIDYFYRLENTVETRHGAAVGKDLAEMARKVGDGMTPDQVSRLVIRRLHDLGVIDLRYGWLEDDPEMVVDLAETCDIPA
jgi:hypothetical protein